MRKRTAFALGYLALLLSALAAQSQPIADADPAKVELASQILGETNASATMDTVLDGMIPLVQGQIRRNQPSVSDDTLKLIGQTFRDEMNADIPGFLKAEAQVYATHFTLEDLQALNKFYQSDVGKRLIAEAPAIAKENIPIGMAWGRDAAQRAMTKAVDKLRAQGVKI